jgi:nucleotide-binding universal stress UspA family protein
MANRLATDPPPEVHLAFVRHPFSLRIDHFMGSDVIENYYSQEAEKAFKPCREMLEQKGIPFFSHIEKGEKAEAIAASAERLHCDLILICAPPAGTLARMFQTLLTNRVMGFTKIPVEVLASKKNSELELQSEAA